MNTVLLETLSEGELPKVSSIKVDKLFTLEKSVVKKKLGSVSPLIMEEVRKVFYSLV